MTKQSKLVLFVILIFVILGGCAHTPLYVFTVGDVNDIDIANVPAGSILRAPANHDGYYVSEEFMEKVMRLQVKNKTGVLP